MNRVVWYAIANAAFALVLGVAVGINSAGGAHPLYLLVLFALCSSPIINLRRLNDRYALLAIFSAVYFQFYGTVDLLNLILGTAKADAPAGLLTQSELVILIAIALAQLGYRVACRPPAPAAGDTARYRDWSEQTLIWMGLSVFAICTGINWIDKVLIFVKGDSVTTARALASLSRLTITAFMVAGLLQPLGILMLAYAQCRFKRKSLTPLLILVVLIQATYGFVIDVKGEVLLGGVLVLLTKVLVDGRIPRTWLIGVAAFVLVAFPALQANRVLRGQSGADHVAAAENFMETLAHAWEAKDKVSSGTNRSEAFYERLSLKGSVDLIVSRTGTIVPYQEGHTLTPLLTVFIPRLFWPTKPDVPTGQLMNKAFNVSDDSDTYISPSHMGELYWNFGWAGVIVGMAGIGLMLGFVGSRFDLARQVTLTRVLVVAVTIRQLILGAEGAITPQYSVWLRALLAIGLLHLLLAHRRVTAVPASGESPASSTRMPPRLLPAAGPAPQPLFPNLLR